MKTCDGRCVLFTEFVEPLLSQLDLIKEDLEALKTVHDMVASKHEGQDELVEYLTLGRVEAGPVWGRAQEAANRMPEHVRMLLRAIGRADVIPGNKDESDGKGQERWILEQGN